MEDFQPRDRPTSGMPETKDMRGKEGRGGSEETADAEEAQKKRDSLQQHEENVLCGLDPRFFTKDFDPVMHMLESLPTNPFGLIDHLQSEIGVMDIAKDVVTAKLAEDIQRNYTSFIQGMNQVQEVDFDLALALIQVKNGRRLLASHKQDLVMSHLELVKLRRNRDRLQTIIEHTTNIMECFKQEQEMLVLLHDREYEQAVHVCIDMRTRFSHLRQFAVLRPILHRMTQALPELRKHFDQALCDLVTAFHSEQYGKLLKAYAALDLELQLKQSIVESIPDVIVRAIDVLTRGIVQDVDQVFRDTSVTISTAMEGFMACFERSSTLLHGYYLFLQWHRDPFSPENHKSSYLHRCGIDSTDGGGGMRKDELFRAFQQHRKLIWDSMQQRVIDLLARFTWPNDSKMEQVVGLSHAMQRFLALGNEFSGYAGTSKLQTAWQLKCRSFLSQMHQDSVELMRMMLDTEKWERLSITFDPNKNILVLLEQRCGYVLSKPEETEEISNLLGSFESDGNPFSATRRLQFQDVPGMERYAFDVQKEDEEHQIIQRMIAMDPYLKGDDDPIESRTSTTPQQDELIRYGSHFVITTSAFSGFLRYCGIYAKFIQEVPMLQDDLWANLLSLFDFVFYAIYAAFCPEVSLQRLVAKQIPSDLHCESVRAWLLKMQQAYPTKPVQYEKAIPSDAFVERVVAMEAIVFQAHVLVATARSMGTSLDPVLAVVQEARTYLFASIAPHVIQAAKIPRMIEHAVWDTIDMADKHSEYVVALVRSCGMFWGTLQGSDVPHNVRDELWQFVMRSIMEALVEGYASVKSCSTEGRALMSMDLVALQNGLDLIHHVSGPSLWGRSYVNNFLKAHYFQEPELLAFIAENKHRYRKAHLVSLAQNGVCGNLRKPAFKDLMHKIELIFRSPTSSQGV